VYLRRALALDHRVHRTVTDLVMADLQSWKDTIQAIGQSGVADACVCSFALAPAWAKACTAPAPHGAHLPLACVEHDEAGCQPSSRFSAAGLFSLLSCWPAIFSLLSCWPPTLSHPRTYLTRSYLLNLHAQVRAAAALQLLRSHAPQLKPAHGTMLLRYILLSQSLH
jgi:hypothetical protein